MKLIATNVRTSETSADDPRVGQLLGRRLSADEPARVSIIGFGVDSGVARNGGRAGASEGPRAIREALYRMCPDARCHEAFTALLEKTRDLGDLESTTDLERDQEALSELVARELHKASFVIVLGGGHETAYGHFLGYVKANTRVAIQNIDAHADVRPLKDGLGHSGSPFRQALEHPSRLLTHYRVDGLQPTAVAASHLTYLRERGASYRMRNEFRAEELFVARGGHTLATFCLDALDQAFAPGVSAPSSDGLTPELWLHAAFRAGACPSVRSLDVVELNPRLDRDSQTARIAARTVWEALRGLLQRQRVEA